MAAKRWMTWAAIAVMIVMVASAVAVVGEVPAQPAASTPAASLAAASVAPVASPAPAAASTLPASTAVYSGAVPTKIPLQIDTARASAVQADEANFVAAGGNPAYFFPPNLHEAPAAPTQTGGHVLPLYSYAPAPMGLGDFGLRNTSGTITPYVLNTTSVAGTFSTGDPWGTQSTNLEFGSLQAFGMQLNTVLVNTTLFGQDGYYMWLQNVPNYNPTTGALTIENNIWNFSNNPDATFPSSNAILHGSGRVSGGVYEASGGTIATVQYPFSLAVYLNTTVGSYDGSLPVNEVYFNYSVWGATGQLIKSGSYDNVYFNSIARAGFPQVPIKFGSAEIEANGLQYSPLGLTDDIEWDWGIGSSSGANANTMYANATLGLEYLNGTTHKWSADPSAWDFGAETGETTMGSYGTWSTSASGQPVEQLRTGPSILTGLWNASSTSGSFAVNYAQVIPGNAWIFVAPGASVSNLSFFNWAPSFGWFTPRGRIGPNIYLAPGTYTVEVLLSGYNPVFQTVSGSNGAVVDLNVALVKNAASTTFTPDYAFTNSDLANLSVSGAGTVSNPYLLFSGQGASQSLSPVFGQVNDYFFSVWQGIYINATTAYAKWAPVPSLLMTFPSWIVSCCITGRFVLPPSNHYQVYLYHTQDLSIVGGTIGGWLENTEQSSNFWLYANTAKNLLIANVTFDVYSEGLEFLGGGAAQNNTVWGNTFTPVSIVGPPTNYTVASPSTGLVVTESGDHIYNNAFYTNRTATSAAADHNFWNVTGGTQPASYVLTANGVALTGANILGQNFQGGNFWRDYGATPNPYGVLPYVSRQTSPTGSAGIGFGGDFNPLSLVATQGAGGPGLYPFVVTESGLANAASWTIRVTGVPVYEFAPGTEYHTNPSNTTTVSTSLVTNILWLPNGTYTWKLSAYPTTRSPSITTGTVTIDGFPASVGISFNQVTYVVSFKESGLPVSTVWSVDFNGVLGTGTVTATQQNVTFSIANGTGYTYKIGAVAGYTSVATPTTVTVAGAPVTVTVTFAVNVVQYRLYFTESGLPTSTSWSVTVSPSGSASGTSTTLSIGEPNGTYTSFSFTPVSGYTATPSVSSVTISGVSVSVGVTFTPIVYTVTFTESGLPANTLWAVTLNGVIGSSAGTTITFSVINGVYAYTAGYEAGYTSATTGGPSSPLTVSGASVGVTITFTAIPSAAHPIGLPVGLAAELRPVEMRT